MKTMWLLPNELKLADTVRLNDGEMPWCYAIVKQIKDGNVTLFRPYGTTADFSYTGGVITYVGIDEFTIPMSDHRSVEVVERKELK